MTVLAPCSAVHLPPFSTLEEGAFFIDIPLNIYHYSWLYLSRFASLFAFFKLRNP